MAGGQVGNVLIAHGRRMAAPGSYMNDALLTCDFHHTEKWSLQRRIIYNLQYILV